MKLSTNLKKTTILLPLFILTVLLSGCAGKSDTDKKAAAGGKAATGTTNAAAVATPIRVTEAVRQIVTRKVPVTGSLAALQTVQLSPKVSARIISVAGREGTIVRKNQIVVQQDTTDFTIQVQQAQANLEQAQSTVQQNRARLQQAYTQYNLQGSTSKAGVRDAEQQLTSAREALILAKNPQRTQEIAVTTNAVAQAQANYDRAKSDRQRYEALVKEGAAAQITLDQYVNSERVAKAALDTAKEQQNLAQVGGRDESVRQADAAVRRAEVQLRLARANVGQVQVKQDDIAAAKSTLAASEASVDQLKAALKNARQQVEYASIVSPIDGVITARTTEPGQQAAPGANILTIVSLDSVYFEAQVPEVDTASMRQGLPVQVRVDAYPGKVFNGQIARLLPTANSTSRAFVVRVQIPNERGALRPGYFARGDVIAERRSATVVPRDAFVADENGGFALFVAENGKASRRTVQIGIQNDKIAEIKSGVKEGEQIVIAGQDSLKDGAPVQIKKDDNPQRSASRTAPSTTARL